MNKRSHKFLYSILAIIVLTAAVVFVRTLVLASMYIPDSGVIDALPSDSSSNAPSASTELPVVSGRSSTPTKAVAAAPKVKPKPPTADPSRLLIPSLNINANVQYVGLAKSGSIGTPNNFTDVAWYAYGPIPGTAGAAIIDGHVDNGLSLPGVFKYLSSIKVGDSVIVVTNGGTYLNYLVSSVDSFDYKDVPVTAIFSQSGPSQIKLITCEGIWVQADKTYDKRLVVTASLK